MSQHETVPTEELVKLAVEHWRLAGALKGAAGEGALVRHSLRKMQEVLSRLGVEVRSLDGIPYDAGLSARVMDRMPAPWLKPGEAVIGETVSPLVTIRGEVARAGEVVLHVGNAPEA